MREFELSNHSACVKLRSTTNGSTTPYEPWEYEAEIHCEGLVAHVKVYDHLPNRFAEFFDDLAINWQGWDSSKTYQSLEYNLNISATHDHVGLAIVNVELRSDSSGLDGWIASKQIYIESGQLQEISHLARKFTERE